MYTYFFFKYKNNLLYHGIIMGPYLYIFLYILLFVVGGLKGIMNPSI